MVTLSVFETRKARLTHTRLLLVNLLATIVFLAGTAHAQGVFAAGEIAGAQINVDVFVGLDKPNSGGQRRRFPDAPLF